MRSVQEALTNALKHGGADQILIDLSLRSIKAEQCITAGFDCLVDAIEKVHQGQTLVKPAITDTVLQGLSSIKSDFACYDNPEALTAKETQVLRLMAAGYSNKEIADVMFKSQGTIKNQVSTILAKLGVRDRTRAVL